MSTDWSKWHDAYATADSGLPDRLAAVRDHIDRRLDDLAPDPVRMLSACAGDGRDLLGVLSGRADANRVSGLLVELDPELAARGRRAADALPAHVEVLEADAARSDVYAHAVPADLVLLCGIFGNISDDDVRATIRAAPQLCAPGAELVWTRHRHDREWFADVGFEEIDFVAPQGEHWSVGVHRVAVEPRPLEPGRHWFTFLR